MNTSTDYLKNVTFGVMAILFFVNILLMETGNRAGSSEATFLDAGIDQSRQPGMNFDSKTEEIEFLRATAINLKATQIELIEEIDRIESRIRAIEMQVRPSAVN